MAKIIWRAGPITEDEIFKKRNGSGNKIKMIVAKIVPSNEANPPRIMIVKSKIILEKAKEFGSMNEMYEA